MSGKFRCNEIDEEKAKESLERDIQNQTGELESINRQLKLKVEECEQARNLMRIQRDLSISLASTDDLKECLTLSLEAARQISGMDSGGIYLFDEVTKDLNLIVYRGMNEEFIKSVCHYDKNSAHVRFVKLGKPAYLLHADLPLSQSKIEIQEGLKAVAILPLLHKEQMIGCMNLGSHTIEEVSSSVRVSLETTAAQIGSAVSRLKARLSLQESEEHLRSLMVSAKNFAVYRLASDKTNPNLLKVIFVSPSIEDILGINSPMNFDSWFENMHPEDIHRISIANKEAFKTFRFNEEYRTWNPKKKEWRWIHAISTGTKNERGWTGYVNGIMIDVTETHIYKEMLEKSKEHLQSLMESASGFVVYRMVRDDREPYNLKMAAVSPSIEEILGYKPENFEVSSYYDHIHPDDVEGVMEAHKIAFQTGKFERTARVYNIKTGEYPWIHAISIAVRDKKGVISHVNGLLIDVTEKYEAFRSLKRSEKELIEKEKKQRELNAALNVLLQKRKEDETVLTERLAANVNQLILPYLEKMRSPKLDADKKALLEIIHSNLNEIMAPFSYQLSSKNFSLTPTEIKIADLIAQGRKSKEIAKLLNLSHKTVDTHRHNIRKKLQISNKKVNLRTLLLSMKNT